MFVLYNGAASTILTAPLREIVVLHYEENDQWATRRASQSQPWGNFCAVNAQATGTYFARYRKPTGIRPAERAGAGPRLKVDAATALRIILKMGFGSYREFQHYLHELSVSQATSLDMMQTSKTKGSSLSAHIQEAVDSDVQNLQRFRNVLDSERIAAVAKRLHQASRIILLGGDLASNLVGYLHYHLILLGLPAMTATRPERRRTSRARAGKTT